MAAPAWVHDYREEMLANMTEQRRADAGSMGYGYRVEQLFRGEGTLTIDSVEGSGSTFTCHFPRSRLVQPPAEYRRNQAKA